ARGKRHWALAGVALAAACSLQNFDYLQVPEEGPLGGSSGSATGGNSGNSGNSGSESGGTSGTTTGGKGGSNPTGGTSGSGGLGGTAGAAGDTGEGGEATGGSSTGGTGGTGAVGELVNPSFETNNTNGWTVSPAQALSSRWVYTQAPTGTVAAPDGAYELATWHNMTAYQVELSQRVTGLEDGTYTFSGYFSWGLMINEIYLFARNCSDTDPDPMPVPATPSDSFIQVSLTGINVVGGSCEVGLYVDGSINAWMNADKFALEPE
ncbi:MAG TPA: hypothetical protein VF103_08990, partial [Polyangiaceae bacterium]